MSLISSNTISPKCYPNLRTLDKTSLRFIKDKDSTKFSFCKKDDSM